MDELTQRNASASEELFSTAEELSAQAQASRELIASFQLPGTVDRRRVEHNVFGDVPPKLAAHSAASRVAMVSRPGWARAAAAASGAGQDSGFQRF